MRPSMFGSPKELEASLLVLAQTKAALTSSLKAAEDVTECWQRRCKQVHASLHLTLGDVAPYSVHQFRSSVAPALIETVKSLLRVDLEPLEADLFGKLEHEASLLNVLHSIKETAWLRCQWPDDAEAQMWHLYSIAERAIMHEPQRVVENYWHARCRPQGLSNQRFFALGIRQIVESKNERSRAYEQVIKFFDSEYFAK
ncbi:MAG TPA: hypothetical protein VEJ63_19115 [Planctomycetota bacterium]|nr:hypothetical protein [Planctomycetota bacterium]